MSEAERDAIRDWLTKSEHDLGSAHRLLDGHPPYLDTAVYHCQQAVEKALKALLIHHSIRFERTHDLTLLVQMAIGCEPTLAEWQDAAEALSPYSVRFRYLALIMEPSYEDAQDALQQADAFVSHIIRLIALP